MTTSVPIRRKLSRIALVSSGSALVVTTLLLMGGEFLASRDSALQQLRILNEAIASNSTAALAFDNPDDARDVLAAFKSDPHIVAAALYDAEGKLFVSYPRQAPPNALPATPGTVGYRFENAALIGVAPVVEANKLLGTLVVRSDMLAIYQRLALFAAIALIVMLLALAAAWVIARRMQRQLSRPILDLADAAQKVSDAHDYSIRAHHAGVRELDKLTAAFNHMLDQTQASERRLNAQVNRLALLQEITHSIGSRHDLHSIFGIVLRSLEEHLPIDFGCLCVHDGAQERLTVESVGPASIEHAGKLGLRTGDSIAVGHNGLYRCMQGTLIHEPDVGEVDSPVPSAFAAAGFLSLVLAPLAVESNVFGVLVVARHAKQSFSSSDCEFLKQLSEHVALAAHQAQLYGTLQRTYDDLRQSQQTVLQTERLRALGQMASGIAHDINNAISPVSLYTELLQREPHLSDAARSRLATMQQALDDVAGTIARMREFYRPRESNASFRKLDFAAAINQVIELTGPRWRALPQERGVHIELRRDLAASLPEAMGDDVELRDALTNLVFNAVDAMPDGGSITLRTRAISRAGGARVALEVVDTGIGMNEETRRRCIEPFFTTKGERGTGLGLASVYGMAQRHNAELEIDSTPGAGTTMRIVFPALSAPAAASRTHAPAPTIQRRLRILLVDDDPVLIHSLRDALEADGHAVESSLGGQAGIEAFSAAHRAEQPFAVVITDLGMPKIDGRKVAAAVKEVSPATPVILLTGWGQRLMDEGDVPPNVNRVLSKPPRLAQLRAALAEVVP